MNTDVFLLDGHAYSWRRLCDLRREQLEAWREAQPLQPALFELKHDCRPALERGADQRYREPTFLDLLRRN